MTNSPLLSASPDELANAARQELAALARVDAASVRQVEKKFLRLLREKPAKQVYGFVRSLLNRANWAERVVAWETLAAHATAFQFLNDAEVEKMAQDLDDWASVDLFGVAVLGRAWREGLVSDQKVESWAHSTDRWRRRLALVATVPLNSKARGGKGDAKRTLWVCRMLLDDRDDMVVKASSWALRELAKRKPEAVRRFIERNSDRTASRVKREVLNKLTTGRKS